jgi:tRNA A-37 threonylcarbamoyl transferase component Bud32
MAQVTPIDQFCNGRLGLPELLTQIDQTFSKGDSSEQSALLDSWRKNELKKVLDRRVYNLIDEKLEAAYSKTRLDAPAEDKTVIASSAVGLRPGYVLNGRFILEEVLGQGGMGVVYRATDLRRKEAQDRDPNVAIKVLSDDFRNHPDSFRALQREARKAQGLAHPNIIAVYDFDREGSLIYLTMEYLSGTPLDKQMKSRKGPRPVAQVLPIVKAVAAALAFAHENGIVHSDLKPANIFITDNGRVKVIDFGIARAVNHPDALGEREVTVFDAGQLRALTPAYASIEMIEGQPPDARDDIFALGCITYELITGRHPYGRVMATDARDEGIVAKKPRQLSSRQWRALAGTLSLIRQDRTPTAQQFINEFAGSPKRLPLAAVLGGGAAAAMLVGLTMLYFIGEVSFGSHGPEVVRSGTEPSAAEAERRAAEEAKQRASQLAAAEASKRDAERLAAEASRRETERQAAAAARQETERQAAAETARKETERQAAAETARKEAERQAAAETAHKEAERQAAAETARKEAERQAAADTARKEAERQTAADTARKEAERQATAEAARKEAERQAAADAARKEAERQAAADAARKEAERQAVAETARNAAERQAVEVAGSDLERQGAEATRKEAERKAADATQSEAKRKAAEAAQREAERKAAEAAQSEAKRKAAEAAQREPERKAAEAAQSEAKRKAAEAAQLEAERKAADAARRETQLQAADAAREQSARDGKSGEQVAVLNVPKLSEASLMGSWCSGPIKIRLSSTEWRFQPTNGSETVLPVTQYRVSSDKIIVYSKDTQNRDMTTEFGGVRGDQMTQIRGKFLSSDSWNTYDRVFKKC